VDLLNLLNLLLELPSGEGRVVTGRELALLVHLFLDPLLGLGDLVRDFGHFLLGDPLFLLSDLAGQFSYLGELKTGLFYQLLALPCLFLTLLQLRLFLAELGVFLVEVLVGGLVCVAVVKPVQVLHDFRKDFFLPLFSHEGEVFLDLNPVSEGVEDGLEVVLRLVQPELLFVAFVEILHALLRLLELVSSQLG